MRQEKQKKRGGEKAIVFNYLFNRFFLPHKMYKMKKEKNTLKNKSGETVHRAYNIRLPQFITTDDGYTCKAITISRNRD